MSLELVKCFSNEQRRRETHPLLQAAAAVLRFEIYAGVKVESRLGSHSEMSPNSRSSTVLRSLSGCTRTGLPRSYRLGGVIDRGLEVGDLIDHVHG